MGEEVLQRQTVAENLRQAIFEAKHLPDRHDQKTHGKNVRRVPSVGVEGKLIGDYGGVLEVSRINNPKEFLSGRFAGWQRAYIFDMRTGKLYIGDDHSDIIEAVKIHGLDDRSVRFGSYDNKTVTAFLNETGTTGLDDETKAIDNIYKAFDKLVDLGMPRNTKAEIISSQIPKTIKVKRIGEQFSYTTTLKSFAEEYPQLINNTEILTAGIDTIPLKIEGGDDDTWYHDDVDGDLDEKWREIVLARLKLQGVLKHLPTKHNQKQHGRLKGTELDRQAIGEKIVEGAFRTKAKKAVAGSYEAYERYGKKLGVSEQDKESFKKILENGIVTIATPLTALSGILESGRIIPGSEKQQYLESRGTQVNRSPWERKQTGNVERPASALPIYGYLDVLYSSDEDRVVTSQYGKALIVPKQNVRLRTTYAIGDSGPGGAHPFVPLEMDDQGYIFGGYKPSRPNFYLMDRQFGSGNKYDTSAFGNGPKFLYKGLLRSGQNYIETQVHGGLSLDDIAEIRLPKTKQAGIIAKIIKVKYPKIKVSFYTSLDKSKANEPTDAQKEAGNYKKKHIDFNGLDVSVENEAGSTRSGKNKDGSEWSCKMYYDYGYIKRTEGVDGDHVDVYIGSNKSAESVYVVHQTDPKTGEYDEDKCMLGFDDEDAARKAYLKQYDSPKFLGAMSAIPFSLFKEKVLDDKGEPIVPDAKRLVAGEKLKSAIADVEKHLPTQHDQKTHGKKGIFASSVVVTRSKPSENDIKAWSARKDIVQPKFDRDLRLLAMRQGNLFLRDASGVPQAAATIEITNMGSDTIRPYYAKTPTGKYLSIELLAVAPWHSSKSKERVSGYGTAMMRKIVDYMKPSHEGIFLHASTPNAVKFYRAIGMKETKGRYFYWLKNDASAFARSYDRHYASK